MGINEEEKAPFLSHLCLGSSRYVSFFTLL